MKTPVFIAVNIFLFVILDLVCGHFFIQDNSRRWYSNQMVLQSTQSNRVFDPMYRIGFVPNTKMHFYWYDNTWYPIYINSLGLLDREIRTIPPTTDKHRILFLGDSFTEGVGFPYDRTFVGLISKSLDNNKYDVLNAGITEYYPRFYVQKAKHLINSNIQIHEVVIMLDYSDIHNEVFGEKDFVPAEESSIQDAKVREIKVPIVHQIGGFFIDNSLLTNYIYTITVKKPEWEAAEKEMAHLGTKSMAWSTDDGQYDNYGKEGLELCRQHLNELIVLLRQNSISDITLVVYPWKKQIDDNDLHSKQVTYWEEFASENDIRFVNLFPVFFERQKGTNLYIGDGHFNEIGHQLVAETLIHFVEQTTGRWTVRQ